MKIGKYIMMYTALKPDAAFMFNVYWVSLLAQDDEGNMAVEPQYVASFKEKWMAEKYVRWVNR